VRETFLVKSTAPPPRPTRERNRFNTSLREKAQRNKKLKLNSFILYFLTYYFGFIFVFQVYLIALFSLRTVQRKNLFNNLTTTFALITRPTTPLSAYFEMLNVHDCKMAYGLQFVLNKILIPGLRMWREGATIPLHVFMENQGNTD
jgi:hypothetical protein